MEENKLNDLVIVEQLPIIKEQLQIISDEVEKEIEYALSLKCDDDSKKEVKDARTRLNNINKVLEEKRKQVKNAVLKPYEEFETVYNDLVKNKLKDADEKLKDKIDAIEIVQKSKKEGELRKFALQYFVSNNIADIVSFDDIGLNITLGASMKSLEDKILEFVKMVCTDLKLIELEDETIRYEILEEYRNNLNFALSKTTVVERHKKIEEFQQRQQNIEKQKQEEQKVVEVIEEITAPKEIIQDEEIITVQFTVKANKTQIRDLKWYLESEGIEYV